MSTRTLLGTFVLVCFLTPGLTAAPVPVPASWPAPAAGFSNKLKNGSRILAAAFAKKKSGFFVKFNSKVVATLPDDTVGSPHQKFIVKTASGQTLLVAHNLDLSSRVTGLRKGTALTIHGEYIWSGKGGIIHKTHLSTNSTDPHGWIRKTGKAIPRPLGNYFP